MKFLLTSHFQLFLIYLNFEQIDVLRVHPIRLQFLVLAWYQLVKLARKLNGKSISYRHLPQLHLMVVVVVVLFDPHKCPMHLGIGWTNKHNHLLNSDISYDSRLRTNDSQMACNTISFSLYRCNLAILGFNQYFIYMNDFNIVYWRKKPLKIRLTVINFFRSLYTDCLACLLSISFHNTEFLSFTHSGFPNIP